MSLTDLAKRHGTDKYEHGYMQWYEQVFRAVELDETAEMKVLEIGVLDGASLRMWKEAFPNSDVYGIDINDRSAHEEDRIIIRRGKQENIPWLKKYAETYGPWDIVIDDGSHVQKHQMASFGLLFSWFVKPGGLYVIEDLQCSYNNFYGGGIRHPGSTVEYVKRQIDELHCDSWSGGTNPMRVKSLYWFPGIVFVRKE